jgi:hypothetical protein
MSARRCAAPGCEGPHSGWDYCNKHYLRLRDTGKLDLDVKSMEQRFWEKVSKTETCWIWTAAVNGAGYGIFRNDSRNWRAHRVAYELLVGPIPPGMPLDHMCHTRACVNPVHLQPVTTGENAQNRRGAMPRNSSGVRGVSWNKRQRKWSVYAKVNGRRQWGGVYDDLAEAEATAIALRNRLMTNNLLDRAS